MAVVLGASISTVHQWLVVILLNFTVSAPSPTLTDLFSFLANFTLKHCRVQCRLYLASLNQLPMSVHLSTRCTCIQVNASSCVFSGNERTYPTSVKLSLCVLSLSKL